MTMPADQIDEKSIFNIARRIDSPELRAEYLQQACGGNAEALQRVDALLRVHDQKQSFLESPAVAVRATTDQSEPERPGTQIGPYKLLQQIGEGGMGVVYMAEQHEPVKRRVALKIIKPGMDSRQVIARFEAERQALSLMDHPNIAKVLDAGTTDSGRPYFVMELVKGQPITQYCDEKHLTPRQRLELLLPVCQAIQHAHQKGIIHRDIKPTNILVAEYDQKAVPKVIDFGVAKATSQTLTEKTMFTGLGQIVGTLEYMSPEQAKVNQLDIDTRSDIYSLGVLLYELLTGSTPFDRQRLRSAAFDEMLRIIREEEPQKPSTRLSDSGEALASISAQRHTEPAKLSKLVRGELDWIVMKALEKDRNRRYETANGLAMDIHRYLADEQVQACPPSAGYRLRKFARRNKVAIGTLAIVAAALLSGILVSTWQAVRASNAEAFAQEKFEAEKQARQEAIANLRHALEAVDQMLTRVGDEVLVDVPQMQPVRKSLLEDALRFYQRFLRDNTNDPAIALETSQAYRRVGTIYRDFGRYPEGEQSLRRALALIDETKVEGGLNTRLREARAKTLRDIGFLLSSADAFAQIRAEDAEKAYRQASNIWRELAAENPKQIEYRDELGECLPRLGHALQRLKQLKQAEALFHEAITIRKELVANARDNPTYRHRLAISYFFLGNFLKETDRTDETEAAFREAVEVQEKVVNEAPDSAVFRYSLAEFTLTYAAVLKQQGQKAEALAFQRRAVDQWKRLRTEFPDVPDIFLFLIKSYGSLGSSLREGDRLEEAEEAFRDAIALGEKIPLAFPDVRRRQIAGRLAGSYSGLSAILAVQGHNAQAVDTLRRGVKLWDDWRNEPAPELAWIWNALASLLDKKGERAEAIEAHRQAIAAFEKLPPAFAEKAPYRNSLDKLRKRFWALQLGYHDAAQALRKKQHLPEAEAAFREGIALLSKFDKANRNLPAGVMTIELARCYRGLGETMAEEQRHQEAIDALQQAIKLREQLPHEAANRTALTHDYYLLSLSYQQLDRMEDALRAARTRLTLWEAIAADDPQSLVGRKGRAFSHADLGHLLIAAGQTEEATATYRQAVELIERLTADFPEDSAYGGVLENLRQRLAGLPKTTEPAPKPPSN